jgi:cell division protein FtsA
MKNNYICALDLGSSKIAAGLAVFSKKEKISSLYLESVPSRGFKHGKIMDPVDLSDSLGKLLNKLKVKSGINVKSVYINIYGQDIITKHSRATIALAERGNKIVTQRDMQRSVEEALILGSRLEEEIIEQMPVGYKIDDQDSIINPLGLYGHALSVDLYLICAKSSYIQTVHRLMCNIGYDVRCLFLSATAVSKIVFGPEQSKNGCRIFVDIGSDLAQIYLFKEGMLRNIETVYSGGDELTYELARTIKAPFELAEDIKRSYATIGEYKAAEDKQVMIRKDAQYDPVSQRLICEVVTAKAAVLIESIKMSAAKMVSGSESIESFMVGGRAVLLDGFLEMMEAALGFPVKMIRFYNREYFDYAQCESVKSAPRFLNFATVLGIIHQAFELTRNKRLLRPLSHLSPLQRVITRAKEIYQEYF